MIHTIREVIVNIIVISTIVFIRAYFDLSIILCLILSTKLVAYKALIQFDNYIQYFIMHFIDLNLEIFNK